MANEQAFKTTIDQCQVDFERHNDYALKFQTEALYAMQAILKNEKLQECSHDSIRNSIINVALLGLSLDPVLSLAYLVPRKKECCLDISYRGHITVMTDPDNGFAKKVWGDVIKERDHYDIIQAPEQQIIHKPAFNTDRGQTIGAYAIAKLNNGEFQMVIKDRLFIDNVRSQSPSNTSEYSAWVKNYDEMALKTMIRNLFKYVAKSNTNSRIKNLIAHEDKTHYLHGENAETSVTALPEAVKKPAINLTGLSTQSIIKTNERVLLKELTQPTEVKPPVDGLAESPQSTLFDPTGNE